MRVLLVVLALVCGVCYAAHVGYGGRVIGFSSGNFGGVGGQSFAGFNSGRPGGRYYGRRHGGFSRGNLGFGGFNGGSIGGNGGFNGGFIGGNGGFNGGVIGGGSGYGRK
ncbi:glycine-rich RNA-binding protein 1-like isoform X2 [Homarus americanus]|uniref:glycine-rich RNA-binding protein 1-like isoform X2 n=1 Tax=Homarus americanus TaxID=6706 RepID=UPI001C476D1D|nr:glycine-rich RNA-binding protein 1-like isoform X2 [Homarus americanus]